jgi:hypothetical protein
VSRAVAVLRDSELVELLADEPELLAIADAIAATSPTIDRHRSGPRLAAVGVALVAAVAVALGAPWSTSRGSVIQKALAAVSARDVLHVVLVSVVPGLTTVDLRTGRATAETLRVEQWFDAQRALRSYTVAGAGQSDAFLETPQGVWSSAGRVPTCAWIAAHPVKASRLRVSCDLSGRNGTTPRQIAETRPTADPALAAFLTGYRAALRSGAARSLGPGRLSGKPVFWISFSVWDSRPAQTERVAISRKSFRPLLFETVANGKVSARAKIVAIGTVAFAPSLFRRPALATRLSPAAGEVAKTRHVSLRVAEAALGRHARSLGTAFGSLPLIDARTDELTTGYGPLSGRPVTRAPGVEFIYGDSGGTFNGNPFLRVSEALSPQMAYGMRADVPGLPSGSLLLSRAENETITSSGHTAARRTLWFGSMRVGSLYVALQAGSRELLLTAAKTLERGA